MIIPFFFSDPSIFCTTKILPLTELWWWTENSNIKFQLNFYFFLGSTIVINQLCLEFQIDQEIFASYVEKRTSIVSISIKSHHAEIFHPLIKFFRCAMNVSLPRNNHNYILTSASNYRWFLKVFCYSWNSASPWTASFLSSILLFFNFFEHCMENTKNSLDKNEYI